MVKKASLQRSGAAYQTILDKWPVPYEVLSIPTRFGATTVVACGPFQSPPVLLLHPGSDQAPVWFRNVEALSRSHRLYAVDLIRELNKRIPSHPIRSHGKFMDWMADLFDGLDIESADLVSSSNGWFFALETAMYLPGRARKSALNGAPDGRPFTRGNNPPAAGISILCPSAA